MLRQSKHSREDILYEYSPTSILDSPLGSEKSAAVAVLSLLICPLCASENTDDRLLKEPVTLACGHSMCALHLPVAAPRISCPINGCPYGHGPLVYGSVAISGTASTPLADQQDSPVGIDVRLVQIIALAQASQLSVTGIPAQGDFSGVASDAIDVFDRTSQLRPISAAEEGTAMTPLRGIPPRPLRLGPTLHFTHSLLSLLQCEICLKTLEEPITTRCQHTFCSTCLFRSLDHKPCCPLCRYRFDNLSEFYTYRASEALAAISSILPANVCSASTPKGSEDGMDTPIFVCQLSFPGLPTVLHIFEPRYRLMLRRVLASSPTQFGMIMNSSREDITVNYGTMLEVTGVNILADGRSVVQTMGIYRFRIRKRKEVDGYLVAKIERFDDLSAAMEKELEKNATLLFPPRITPAGYIREEPIPAFLSDDSRQRLLSASQSASPPWSGTRGKSISPTPSFVSLSAMSSIGSTPSTSSVALQGQSSFSCSARLGSTNTSPEGLLLSDHSYTPPEWSEIHRSAASVIYHVEPTVQELVSTCQEFIQKLHNNSSPYVIQRLDAIGRMPEDEALLSFWIAQLLPIDETEKAKILPIRSPRLRLRLVVHWIDKLNVSWGFPDFPGCVIA